MKLIALYIVVIFCFLYQEASGMPQPQGRNPKGDKSDEDKPKPGGGKPQQGGGAGKPPAGSLKGTQLLNNGVQINTNQNQSEKGRRTPLQLLNNSVSIATNQNQQ